MRKSEFTPREDSTDSSMASGSIATPPPSTVYMGSGSGEQEESEDDGNVVKNVLHSDIDIEEQKQGNNRGDNNIV